MLLEQIDENLKKEIVEWDCFNWSRALDFWQKHGQVNLQGASALELGARNGGLTLWLALNKANVVCSDRTESQLDNAKILHKRHQVSSLIKYETADATNIPYKDKFDLVVFKSILGGISWKVGKEAESKVISSIHGSLKEGGELWFAENLSASALHSVSRKALKKQWNYMDYSSISPLLSQFSSVDIKLVGCLATFGRNEWQRKLLGMADQYLIEKYIPDNWKYIVVGVARK